MMEILFGTLPGLLSVFSIAFLIVMGGYITWYVNKRARQQQSGK